MKKLLRFVLIPIFTGCAILSNAHSETKGLYFERANVSEKEKEAQQQEEKKAETSEEVQPKKFKLSDWVQIGMKPRNTSQ